MTQCDCGHCSVYENVFGAQTLPIAQSLGFGLLNGYQTFAAEYYITIKTLDTKLGSILLKFFSENPDA